MPDAETHPRQAGNRLDLALTTAAAICIGAAITLAVWALYPKELDVSTDIVGYPIAHDFNVNEYIIGYLLIVVAFPALAIGAYALIRRLSPRQATAATPRALETEAAGAATAADPPGERPISSALARTAFIGAVWSLVLALALDVGDDWWASVLLPVTLGYTAAIYLLSLAGDGSRVDAMATLNTLAAGFLGLGVLAISAGIEVTELDTGNVVDFRLAPAWLLGFLAAAVGVWVAVVAWRERAGRARAIETSALLFLAAPIALWILFAENPGELPDFHLFEAGQRSIGSSLLGDGWVPWRDVILVHGPLEDGAFGLLGMELFDDSYWGDAAGRWMIVGPLYWISNFLLCAYLFRRNLLFLLGTQLVIVLGWADEVGTQRLILLPIVLLALAGLLERATWPRAAALMGVSIAQVVLVQETALMSAAAWLIVLGRDFAAWRGWGPYGEPWVRTRLCLVTGLIAAAVAAITLAALGTLDEFVSFFFTYSRDYELVAGIPFQWEAYDFGFKFWVFATPAVILIGWWYAAARIGSGRWFTTRDLVMGAAVIAVLPYYLKFLARADGHVFNIAAVSLIPLMYIVYRVVAVGEDALRERGSLRSVAHPITALLLLGLVVAAPWSATDVVTAAPTRLAADVSRAPAFDRLGYSSDVETMRLLPKVERAIDRYAGPDGTIFDLTNSPGLFYYLPDRKPGTRYQETSTAVRESTQEDVVEELEAARPELVAYSSLSHGLATWDGIANPVRNYLISDWLLDHYHPVARVDDYVLMTPGAPSPQMSQHARRLYFDAQTCDWSASPNFLNQHPDEEASSAPVALTTDAGTRLVSMSGWAADLDAGEPAERILIVVGDRVIASASVDVPRSDVAQAYGNVALTPVGFEVHDVVVPRSASGEVRVFAVNGEGVAGELGEPTSPLPKALERPDGSTISVAAGAVGGSLDTARSEQLTRYRLELPDDFSSYDWIRVSTDGTDGSLSVTDGGTEGSRTIGFDLINGARTADVRVGACPQWHGYRGRPLYLDALPDTGSIEIELIR